METPRPPILLTIIATTLLWFGWGTTYLGIRIAIETIPPWTMAGTRYLAAGLLVLAWVLLRRQWTTPDRTTWIRTAQRGILMFAIVHAGVTWAQQTVPSGLTALILGLIPVAVAATHAIIPGGDRPTPVLVLAIVLGVTGVELITDATGATNGSSPLAGTLILVATATIWGAGSVWIDKTRHTDAKLPLLQNVGLQMAIGGLVLTVAGLARGEGPQLDWYQTSHRSIIAWTYLVLIGSIATYTAYTWTIQNLGANRAATYAYVNPIVAIIAGNLVVGEAITGRIIIASVLVLSAVYLTHRHRAPSKKAKGNQTSAIAPKAAWTLARIR